LKARVSLTVLALLLVAAGAAYAGSRHSSVQPKEFSPFGTPLITAEWVDGIGCPKNARTAAGNADLSAPGGPGPAYSDPACANGGTPKDKKVQGLLLSKTGPTANFASAQAIVNKPPRTITELGWDIRKPGAELGAGLRGSHCGAGAPRWNITTKSGQTVFIGCISPPATTETPGTGFVRMRWAASTPVTAGGTPTTLGALEVKKLKIVFDEGYDSGPSNFGLAVLDNIDVNGKLVGSKNGGKRHDDDDDDD
jgi:hypothetical protein